MPIPDIIQDIRMAPNPASAAIFCEILNIPPPIIDPKTIAIRP